MLLLSIAHDYFLWHYSRAFKEIFHVWLNFLWFTIQFFSIPQLAAAWFAPFKRITEERQRGFSFEDLAGVIIINLLSRIVGALLRTIIISVGLIVLGGVILVGFVLQITWAFLPFLILAGFVSGIGIMFA